jgi:hypothetical protein
LVESGQLARDTSMRETGSTNVDIHEVTTHVLIYNGHVKRQLPPPKQIVLLIFRTSYLIQRRIVDLHSIRGREEPIGPGCCSPSVLGLVRDKKKRLDILLRG